MSGTSNRPRVSRAAYEVGAVVLTGVVHLLCEEVFHLKGPFIVAALVGWGSYLVYAYRRNPAVVADWGLARRGFWRACRTPAVVLVLGAIALAVAGLTRGTFFLHWSMLPLLALYPIWGIAQQFMVQAMVARNLRQLFPSAWPVVLVTATLFGLVHWPDTFLMGGTFVLGLLFTPIYLRKRHILPLGIAHGWLGVLAYYWLLGRNPWNELLS
jgi:CAAX prenyl protease-like protein